MIHTSYPIPNATHNIPEEIYNIDSKYKLESAQRPIRLRDSNYQALNTNIVLSSWQVHRAVEKIELGRVTNIYLNL